MENLVETPETRMAEVSNIMPQTCIFCDGQTSTYSQDSEMGYSEQHENLRLMLVAVPFHQALEKGYDSSFAVIQFPTNFKTVLLCASHLSMEIVSCIFMSPPFPFTLR